ncbi:MAG: rod shape-determining protein MreC [Helicobacter sp.]|nr:rod shape-determining protein MreC [Helicobacter sp.]
MRYKGIFIFLLVIASLVLLFFKHDGFRYKFLHLSDGIRSSYHNFTINAKFLYERFFIQSRAIAKYQKEAHFMEELRLQNINLQNAIQSIHDIYKDLPRYVESSFYPALVLGYAQVNSFHKVWLKSNRNYSDGKILGIVLGDVAIGIALSDGKRLLGLLNGSKNASYSVFIGSNKTPAIIRENIEDSRFLLADFIPQYFDVNVGDEVVTSGLDNVFIEGLKVGRVSYITDKNGYISAQITPYELPTLGKYVFLIDKNDANKSSDLTDNIQDILRDK